MATPYVTCNKYIPIFSHLDPIDFQNTRPNHENNQKIILPSVDIDDVYSTLSDIDPDKNLLNTHVICNSEYYNLDRFKRECSPKINSDSFSLINFNIRSIPKNLDKFEQMLHAAQCRKKYFPMSNRKFPKIT